jgi:ABC-type lipoprotein release transport system permease subunit
MLYGLTPLDPPTYVAVPILLAAIAVFACLVPARRASRIDSMVAIRCE